MNAIRGVAGSLVILTATASWGVAESLDAPSGDVVLTVSGAVPVTNEGDTAQFDMEMLRSLGETSFTTSTPWTEGQQTFTGVSLLALIEVLGIEGGTLAATAINDYAIDIPVSDAVEGGPIIAYLRNGEEMPIREKGPLWVVYPYDSSNEYSTEVIFSRSIWQLDRIVVSE